MKPFTSFTDEAPWAAELECAPLFVDMSHALKEEGWMLAPADLRDAPYEIDAERAIIRINAHGLGKRSLDRSAYFRHAACLNLILALRTVYMAGPEIAFDPLSHILAARMAQADRFCAVIDIAFHLRLEGEQGLWRHVIGEQYGDMALKYKETQENLGPLADSDMAWAQAFLRFFDSPDRLKACDHATLEMMDNDPGMIGTTAFSPDALNIWIPGQLAGKLSSPRVSDVVDAVNAAHLRAIIADRETTKVAGIAFRDEELARRFFPDFILDA